MLKIFLTLFLSSHYVFAAKLTLDDRRNKILSIVDEELAEVSRLARTQDYKRPEPLIRMAELNLEKARLWREVENERYLAIPAEERAGLRKSEYFSQSTNYFNASNDAALGVVKRFPKYPTLGDVYYILAYNYRELGKDSEAQRYFKLSAGKSSDPKVNAKSKQALADYYYNDKKYSEAIPLYESSLNQEDRWWTKDAFNLAWSYYRMKNYDRAISLMREVHRKSGGKFVDMRTQVERDIGIFYVDANQINGAIKFFESQGINYTDQFVKIAQSIASQGRFEQAEQLLEKVKKIEKDQSKRSEILLAELGLFDKFNKSTEHLSIARELTAIHRKTALSKSQFERLSFQVNKKAAELQKATASDLYKDHPKIKKQKASEAIAYFELSGQLSPAQKSDKTFFQGETAYAANEFDRSISLYINAFDQAKVEGNKKIMTQSLEGMLSSLGKISEKNAEKFYVPVYSRYLSVDQNSSRASSIFVKLFNAQYDSDDITGAEVTLAAFAKSHPSDFKTQEGMLAKVMEHFRKRKSYDKVKSYVGRINDGEFKVSSKYAEALRSLMTKIQIEGVQQSLDRGEKAVALRGYHQIFDSAESTQKAKINAAYNLSALYFELGESNQSYQWALIALKDMAVSDVVSFSDSYLSIAAGLFLRQQFSQSADLSYRMLAKLCRENSTNKAVAFKNAVFIALANNDLDKALEIRDFGKGCSIPDTVIGEVSFEVLKDLAKEKRWESYERLLSELEQNSNNHSNLIRPYEELRLQLLAIGNMADANAIGEKQGRFYAQAKAQNKDIPVEGLDLIAERMITKVKEKKQKLDQIVLTFPEESFNASVKAKLQILDQLTTEVNNIQKVGSGKGIVEAYAYIIEAYEQFGTALKEFSPPGKPQEYVETFRKAMADVYLPILQNARKQRSEIKKLIDDNKILSPSNYAVLFPEGEREKRFVTEKEAVLMDRGGRR